MAERMFMNTERLQSELEKGNGGGEQWTIKDSKNWKQLETE